MSGLPQAIAGHEDPSDGTFRREVATVLFAMQGSIATARAWMAAAHFAPGIVPGKVAVPGGPRLTAEQQTNNQIWSNCLDALNAGADNAQVRVGVLRLLATLAIVERARWLVILPGASAAGTPALRHSEGTIVALM